MISTCLRGPPRGKGDGVSSRYCQAGVDGDNSDYDLHDDKTMIMIGDGDNKSAIMMTGLMIILNIMN
jgi:hypothetical protein